MGVPRIAKPVRSVSDENLDVFRYLFVVFVSRVIHAVYPYTAPFGRCACKSALLPICHAAYPYAAPFGRYACTNLQEQI